METENNQNNQGQPNQPQQSQGQESQQQAPDSGQEGFSQQVTDFFSMSNRANSPDQQKAEEFQKQERGQQSQQQAPQQQAPRPEPIILNGRKFNSREELEAYTRELEQKAAQRQEVVQQASQQPDVSSQERQQIIEKANQPKYSELLFEDPESAIKLIREDIKEEIKRENSQAEATQKTWQEFYSKNSDLKGNEDIVELAKAQIWNDVKNLPISEGLEKIAQHARKRINDIRGSNYSEEETLESKPGSALGQGGTKSQGVKQEVGTQDFFSQLQDFQNRG